MFSVVHPFLTAAAKNVGFFRIPCMIQQKRREGDRMQERKIIALLRERTSRGCTPCWYTMGRCAIRHRSHSAGPSGAGGVSFRGDHAGLGENRSLSGGAGKLEWLADRPHPSCGAESRPADLPARRGRGLSEDPPSPELTPEEMLLRQERQTALQAALEQLSAGERLLFYRKYYYLRSTAQIALELGLTERTVEGRLYRLKRQLQKLPGGDERS